MGNDTSAPQTDSTDEATATTESKMAPHKVAAHTSHHTTSKTTQDDSQNKTTQPYNTKKRYLATTLAATLLVLLVGAGLAVGLIFGLPKSTPSASASATTDAGATGATGIRIYSALGTSAADAAQADIMDYVIADLNGWLANGTYLPLQLTGGDGWLDEIIVIVSYPHYDSGTPSSELAANQVMYDSLPSSLRDSFLTGGNPPTSGCICGGNGWMYMYIPDREDGGSRRVRLIVHEWYHILQLDRCEDGGGGTFTSMVWLWEGAAAYLESMYTAHYGVCTNWQRGAAPGDNLTFAAGPDLCALQPLEQAITQTRSQYNSGGYTLDSGTVLSALGAEQEVYDGTTNNYWWSQTMFAYLVSRSNLTYTLKTFLMSGDCKSLAKGQVTFESIFGFTKAAFYSDLNAWIASSANVSELLPTLPQINELFSHTSLCSNSCGPATNDGTCDTSCPWSGGTDCRDCGATSRPSSADGFPVALPGLETGNSRRRLGMGTRDNEALRSDAASLRELNAGAPGRRCYYL